jgi:hypothetical protein
MGQTEQPSTLFGDYNRSCETCGHAGKNTVGSTQARQVLRWGQEAMSRVTRFLVYFLWVLIGAAVWNTGANSGVA